MIEFFFQNIRIFECDSTNQSRFFCNKAASLTLYSMHSFRFFLTGLSWIPISGPSILPSNAVVAGHDIDGATIYVGRAYHEGTKACINSVDSMHEKKTEKNAQIPAIEIAASLDLAIDRTFAKYHSY